MQRVVEIHHPLVQHHLAHLREEKTAPHEFRVALRCLSVLMATAATRDLATTPVSVATPVTSMTGAKLSQRIALVPILRAGLGMVDPLLELIPFAEVWHLGLYRDEVTAKPVEYYCKIPLTDPADVVFILDPMLATGGSAVSALKTMSTWGVRSIKLLSIIAAPEGIDAVTSEYPETEIIVGAVDRELNSRKFIVPGLGDAGDRIFNTLRSHS
jgi:uracil phosphoribosyltransferase